jgi:hypothetical protein
MKIVLWQFVLQPKRREHMDNVRDTSAGAAPRQVLDSKQLETILCFDTGTIANALSRLRLLSELPVRLRRLDPRRLDVIFDLQPEFHHRSKLRGI